MARGRFITFEGGEGAGKSTQVKLLAGSLRERGLEVVTTREPGGCPTAEEIRAFFLHKNAGSWDVMTQLLVVMAARREHLVKHVWPALEEGKWVISDRYMDSSRIYQGVADGLGTEIVDTIYKVVAGDFWPDMTFLLDLPVQDGLKRVEARHDGLTRFDEQKEAFHEKLRQGYLTLAHGHESRFRVIDALPSSDVVAKSIYEALSVSFELAS